MPPRIVAEISRTWTGKPEDLQKPLLSQQFQDIIKTNYDRGYDLESWQLRQLPLWEPRGLIETIIAVFAASES